ncbi:MuF-C-terminal domain-containing protein [Negativicoccus succinicivorans]
MDNREERQKQADAAFHSSGFGMPKIAPSPIQQEADAAASLVNAKPVAPPPTLWEQVRDSEIGRSYFWGKEDYSRRAKEIADRLQVSPDVVSIAGEESLKRWENTFQTLEMGKRDDEFAQTWSDWNDISQTERAIRVHNYSDVKQTMGVVDNITSGIRQMDAQIKLSAMGNERMELEAQGKNTDELDAKIQNLQKYIMSQSGDGGVIHDTAGNLYMQANMALNSGKEALTGALMGAATGAAAGAAVSAPFGGVGALPGARAGFIQGARLGLQMGMFNRMNEMERGTDYLQYRSGGKYGKMSADTAAKAATAVGVANAVIEFASFRMGVKALGMGVNKIAGRATATGAQSIIRNAAREVASARSVGEAGKIFAKSAGIGVASETAEEVAQQAVSDIAWNMSADPSEGTRKMPVTEIISNAVDAGITAAPTILGMSAVLGTGANIRFVSKAARMLRPDYEIQKEMAVHTVGAQMLKDLEADKQTSALFKKDPELYTKSVQEAADKQGLGAFFVDANALMETEDGRDILNRMVSGNVVSEQALQTAIETEGRLEIPVGVYLQEDFTEQERAAVDKASAWTQDGTTQAEMAAHWENMAASKYAQELQDDIDRMIRATDRVLSDKFSAADEADKETIRQVLMTNPLDLESARKKVRKEIEDNIEQTFSDTISVMRSNLADGGVHLIPGRDTVYDQDRMLRASSNPQWYKDFYATHKRKPRKDEFYEIMLDEEEKEVQRYYSNGVIKSEQDYEDALQQIENVRKMVESLKTIDAYKDTFDELQKEKAVSLRMYLSPDEMKVYDNVKAYMDSVGGDAQESAHQAAYLWAKRAKVFTQMMHDMGHADFVATDYLDMHPLFAMNEYTPDAADKMAAQYLQQDKTVTFITEEERAEFEREGERFIAVLNDDAVSKNEVIRLTTAPEILTALGYTNEDVVISKGLALNTMNAPGTSAHAHAMTPKMLAQIPAALHEPVFVLKSATRKHDSIVVFTDIKDEQGQSVIVPIRFTKNKWGYANQVSSIYGKDAENRFFYSQWARGNVLYASTKKGPLWATNARLQLPRTLLKESLNYELRIARKKGGVKYYRGNYYFHMNEYTPDAADKMATQLMQRNGGIAPREYFQNRYGDGGYDGKSMSNRARAAYELGEKPMSKWTKDEIIKAVEDYLDEEEPETAISIDEIKTLPAWLLRQEFLTCRSWHHTGAFYNVTDFYGLDFKALDLPLAHYQEKIEEHKKELAATKGDREIERQQREARRERREFETRIKELRKYTKYKTDNGLIRAVDDGRVTLEELEQSEREEKAKGYRRYTEYKTEAALIKALRNGEITMEKLEALRDEKDPKRIAARKLAKAQGKKEWLEVVENDPSLFRLLPEQARNDKDVALLAVRRYGLGALSDVGEALKNDPGFIVGAVCRNNGVLSQFAPALLKNNFALLRRVVVAAPRAAGQIHNILSEKSRLEFITDIAKDAPAAVASFLSKERGLSPEEVERIFRSSPKAAELIANDNINNYKKDARGYMERYQAVAREFLKAESRIEYFQTAWHGSPRSFDRFDTNAIGTGTGRKAHGWGLYFSQEHDVAKQYQDKLMRREAKKTGADPSASASLYKVDIPENEVLLDEDTPLNEQSETVRKAIAAYYQSRPDSYTAATADDLGTNTGEYFLRDVVFQMQREGEENPKKAASLLLHKFGIEGITYKEYRDGRCFVIFNDQAVRVLERNGQAVGEMYQDGKAESGIEYFQADAQRGQEYWQVNEDVDPNETLHVVDLTEEVAAKRYKNAKELQKELAGLLRGMEGLEFVTAADGRVTLTKRGSRHIAYSPARLSKKQLDIKQAVSNSIWDIVVHSRRVETTENRKKNKKPHAAQYHRYYTAVRVNTEIYPVRLIVEERRNNEQEVQRISRAELLLYDVIPENNAQTQTKKQSITGQQEKRRPLGKRFLSRIIEPVASSTITIHDLLKGVKSADGKDYYQQKRHVRGMTALRDGRQMLFLFRKDANFSTFVHESGHVFLEDLQQMAAQENAPEWLKKDWQTVKEWTGWKDGADNRTAHEKWARGFETYVREGNAPSRDLKAVFRRFRRWLVGIYQNLLDLGEIPPESIRNVMDRMLATQEEIDAYTAEKALDTMQDVDTKLAARLAKLKARAAEKVEKDAEAKIRKGVEEVLEDAIQTWRTARTEELQKEEIYKHEALAKQFGEDVLNKYYADAAGFKKALEDAGGPMEDRLKHEEQEQRKAFADELMNPESIRAQVEEYMTGELGQADLLEAETRYIARERNKLAGEYMKQLRKLDSRQQTDEQTEAERLAEVLSYLRSELKEHEGARESVKDAQKQLSKMRQQERAAEQELEREQTLVARLKESHAEDAEEHAQKLAEMRQKLADMRKENAAKVQAIKKTAREEINTRLQGLRDVRDSTQGRLRLIEEQAAQTLRQAPIGESLTWKTYQRKIAYYGTLSSKALVRGDYVQAAEMKERQLYHAYLAKHAVMQEQQVDKDIRRLRENLKRMTRSQQPIRLDTQARYFVHHLMYQLGLTGTDAQAPIDGFEMSSIEELLNPDVAFGMGGDPVISPALRAMFEADGRNEKTWRQMPFEAWEQTVQVLQAVYTAGRRMHDGLAIVRKNGEHVSIADAANELALKLKKRYGEDNRDLRQIRNDMTRADRMEQLAGELVTQLIKPEIIMNRLDGRAVGVKIDDDSFHRFIYDPIARAANRKREMTADAKRTLSRIFERRYSRNEMRTMRQERKYQVGNRRAYTKEEILTAALNWGAAENRKRVLHTFGVDEMTMDASFGEILTAKDWDTVEKIWQFIDGYYEERSRVLERETGVPLGKVEAVPFTINGRKFDGGYYPIVYDPQLSQKASDMDVANELAKQMSSNAVFGAGLGATKKRQAVVNRELLLSLDVLPRAVNEAILHISMREAVLDVAHLLDHAALAEPLQKVIGQSQYRMLREWVRDTWREELVRESSAEQFANLLRRNSTFAVMAYRTSTALLNICNIAMVSHSLGKIRTLQALLTFYRHPQRITRRVKEKSSFIAEREENLDRDLARDMKVSGKELSYVGTDGVAAKAAEGAYSAKEAVDRFGYWLITKTDLMFSLPTWQAVYEDTVRAEMERGELTAEQIDAEAVAKADEAVRRIWGSGEIQDQSKVQKGRIMKFFTPFYTFFSVVLNALIEAGYALKDNGNPVPLMSTVLYWLFLQALLETALRGAIDAATGRGPDDDDDWVEYFGKEYLKNFVGTAAGGIPGVNIAATLTMNTLLGEYYQGRGSQVVALRVMDELQDLAYSVGSDKRDWIDIGRSASRVGNRLVGFSDTLTDGFWTLLRVTCTESDATWDEAVADIIFDRKARKAK